VAAVRGGIALIEADLETRKSDDCQPGQILTTLNRVVYDSAQAQLAMTAQCAIIDRDTGEYTLASAGHPNAFSIPREGASLQSIPLMGVRLGEKRNLTEGFQEATGTLGVNEKLVFYTDGLQELGPDEKLLDKKGVVRFFKAMPKSSPLEMIQEVETKLIPLNEGRPLRDDITLVIVERLAHA
jgi:sigma-B regulation protein RsbU (phosphoserine phosphatase)